MKAVVENPTEILHARGRNLFVELNRDRLPPVTLIRQTLSPTLITTKLWPRSCLGRPHRREADSVSSTS